MGRISKRSSAFSNTGTMAQGAGQQKIRKAKYYKAGLYARLSSDQDLKKNESVEIQLEIAGRYVADWNQQHNDKIEIADRYIDLGKTGTNFDRDEFKRLMQDIRLGDINCVIVKDLSRFGRNYLEAGNYIEKIFPFLGVRFIAVADGYDTEVEGNHTKQMLSEIKNLVNDMYAKEASDKARLSLEQRRKNGSYVGGSPPYGYEAFWKDRIRKLRPDKNTAEIVQIIFLKFVEMESCQTVANYLNEKRINPPAVYNKSKEVFCPNEDIYKGWNRLGVERILKSELYIGKLVQGKTSITARKEENRIRKPENEWMKEENSHEALVDVDLYEQAEKIFAKIRERTQSHNALANNCPIDENIFDKVLFCGVCGKKMTRTSHVKQCSDGSLKRKEGYFCQNSSSTMTDQCLDYNWISKTSLLNILSVVLKTEYTTCLGKRKTYASQGRQQIKIKKYQLEQGLQQIEKDILTVTEEESEKYISYRAGVISQEEYVRYRLQAGEYMGKLEKQKIRYQDAIKATEKKGEIYLKAIQSLIKFKKQKELTKDLIEALIDKIYIYPGKRIEVEFAFSDIMIQGD